MAKMPKSGTCKGGYALDEAEQAKREKKNGGWFGLAKGSFGRMRWFSAILGAGQRKLGTKMELLGRGRN